MIFQIHGAAAEKSAVAIFSTKNAQALKNKGFARLKVFAYSAAEPWFHYKSAALPLSHIGLRKPLILLGFCDPIN